MESRESVILDSINEGVFTVDPDWHITAFNSAAEKITGVSRQEAVGRPCSEILRADVCEKDCALRRTLADGAPIVNATAHIVNHLGKRVFYWFSQMDKCIKCYGCRDVCSVDIPLSKLAHNFSKVASSLFRYHPGEDRDAPLPYSDIPDDEKRSRSPDLKYHEAAVQGNSS